MSGFYNLTKEEIIKIQERCNFTADEAAIFKMLTKNSSIVEMSFKLGVSTATVNRIISRIKSKVERSDKMSGTIPTWEKINLSVAEASEISNIGINKIYEMVKEPFCPFVLYVGKKIVIKRKAFEEYLNSKTEI